MILLDTNVISELMKAAPAPSLIQWMDQQSSKNLFIPSITKSEIETGIGFLPEGKRKNNLQLASSEIFSMFEGRCLSFSCDVTPKYANILSIARSAGRPVSVEDALIAAIALHYDFVLATRNVKDFEFIPRLSCINPWESDFKD